MKCSVHTLTVLTSLRNSNDIHALKYSRDGVRLDRRRLSVATELDVLQDYWVEAGVVKLSCRVSMF